MKKYFKIFLFLSIFGVSGVQAQVNEVIQFSGIVVTQDSLAAVPFVNIFLPQKALGTTSDYYGYFSFAAEKGDSVMFSAVGYKRSYFKIPDTLEGNRFSIVHVLNSDTVMLSETVVYPWPTPEEFKDAFMAINPPDDDITRAQRNLDPEQLVARAEAMPMSGSMNFKYQAQLLSQQMYYRGQAPPVTVLNPFAWAKFIKAWKDGEFKRKKKKEDD